LTYKCCFLLALATGRRRSELHALSVSESCIRFAADKSSVTFLTDPAFLAKNQLSEKGSGIIVKAVKLLEQFPSPKWVPNVSVSDVQYKSF
jgi:hypothetical protein